MERITNKLKLYIDTYQQPPLGREVEGTVELLKEAADKIAEYEDLGLTPEQIREMDSLYSEQAKELGEYKATERRLNGISLIKLADAYIRIMEKETGEKYSRGRLLTNEDADKWEIYKNAEEQGLLLKLPCKVGDNLYVVSLTNSYITKVQINKIEIKPTIYGEKCYFIEPVGNRGHLYRYFEDDFGKTLFLTESEAEVALQKMSEMEDMNHDNFRETN